MYNYCHVIQCCELVLIFSAGCADKLVVQAFTSGIAFGHSNEHHSLFISLRKGKNATIDFYNREGDDMEAHKGDIWALDLSKTELPCFDFRDVDKIALVANSNDGWNIESVTTMLGVNGWHGTRWALLTVDMDANFWIDANAGEDRKWRYLTRVWWHPQRG